MKDKTNSKETYSTNIVYHKDKQLDIIIDELESGGSGDGDMKKAIYDPSLIQADAFDMDNMKNGYYVKTQNNFSNVYLSKLVGIENEAEKNTASNVGDVGESIYSGKTGSDLEFKKIEIENFDSYTNASGSAVFSEKLWKEYTVTYRTELKRSTGMRYLKLPYWWGLNDSTAIESVLFNSDNVTDYVTPVQTPEYRWRGDTSNWCYSNITNTLYIDLPAGTSYPAGTYVFVRIKQYMFHDIYTPEVFIGNIDRLNYQMKTYPSEQEWDLEGTTPLTDRAYSNGVYLKNAIGITLIERWTKYKGGTYSGTGATGMDDMAHGGKRWLPWDTEPSNYVEFPPDKSRAYRFRSALIEDDNNSLILSRPSRAIKVIKNGDYNSTLGQKIIFWH